MVSYSKCVLAAMDLDLLKSTPGMSTLFIWRVSSAQEDVGDMLPQIREQHKEAAQRREAKEISKAKKWCVKADKKAADRAVAAEKKRTAWARRNKRYEIPSI